jgi:hypothetical protein
MVILDKKSTPDKDVGCAFLEVMVWRYLQGMSSMRCWWRPPANSVLKNSSRHW